MKWITIVFILMFLPFWAFGLLDDTGADLSAPFGSQIPTPNPDVDIEIDILNTFTCSYSSHILGLDYVEDESLLGFDSSTNKTFFYCDPDDGTYVDELYLAYSSSPFCAVADDNGYVYVDDWSQSNINWWDGSWHSFSNPSGSNGRGMDYDFDSGYLWETNSSTGVYRFLTDGTGSEFFTLSEVPSQMSGLTVFPHGDNMLLMVTTYGTFNFYFYEFDGSSLTYLTYEPCPTGCSSSLGLTYSAERDTFFWSYNSGGYKISELDITFTFTSVQPASLGYIKALMGN